MTTGALDSRARGMTADEWARLPDDAPGELVDGRLQDEEMPDYVHEVVVAWLVRVLGAWVAPRGGLVGGSDAKFALGKHHGRKPDVSLYLPESKKPARRGPVRVAPDLMVEVLSLQPRDARRDRLEKTDEYARFGVRRYWLVDPEARTFEAFELDASGRYVHILGASSGKVTVVGLDGLVLDLDELWAETDRLAEE